MMDEQLYYKMIELCKRWEKKSWMKVGYEVAAMELREVLHDETNSDI